MADKQKKLGKIQLIYNDRMYNLKKKLASALKEAEEAEAELKTTLEKKDKVRSLSIWSMRKHISIICSLSFNT